MKVYSEMKDSSVKWLSMIPEHWEERFLEQVCSEKCMKNIGNKESNVLSLSYGYIVKKRNVYSGLVAKDFSTYQVVNEGDIILRFTDLQNDHRSLRTGLVTQTGIITSAYTCIRPSINSAYLHYLLHAYDLIKVFYGMGGGVRQSISYKDVRHMFVPVPPREEQDQIVRFLDWKVSEMNRLIHIRKRQIEKLEELKKAVVSQAVTKGLNPTALLKKSDIPGVSLVCLSYKIMPLKHAFIILDKYRKPVSADKRNQNTDILYDYYGASGIIDKIDGYTIDDDVLLIGEDGANLRMRNLPLVYQVHGKAWINNHAHILKPKEITSYYFAYYMLESLDINLYITGAAQPKFTQEALSNLRVIVPPIEEQDQIVTYLDDQTAKINTAIENKHQQMKTLQEFKTRLISDVVTGKIDVRGIEIPEYERTADVIEDEIMEEELDKGADEE